MSYCEMARALLDADCRPTDVLLVHGYCMLCNPIFYVWKPVL